jgi:hypothetical protein
MEASSTQMKALLTYRDTVRIHCIHIKKIYNIFALKSEAKKPLERRKRRWEDNIKMGLKDTE